VEARWAHNPKVAGSNPAPATKINEASQIGLAFSFAPEKSYNNIDMDNEVDGTNLQSILAALQKLSQADRRVIAEALQSKPSSLLEKPMDGYEDWINELRLRGLADGTITLYSRTVRKLLEQYPVPTARDVRAYLASRLEMVKAGKLSEAKVRNDQKSLRSFFNFLEEQSLWLDNPVKTMRLMKIAKRIRGAPKAEDVERLLSAWQGSAQRERDRLLIALLVATGGRITEICSIRKENIDSQEQTIKIMGKGRKERKVPVPAVVVDQIRQYMGDEGGEGYLFPANNKLGYQGTHSLEKTFRRLCRRLGIEPAITPHQLRHFYASVMLKNGAKIQVVSRLLGHSSVAITDAVYTHIGEDEIKSEYKKYSPFHDKED